MEEVVELAEVEEEDLEVMVEAEAMEEVMVMEVEGAKVLLVEWEE